MTDPLIGQRLFPGLHIPHESPSFTIELFTIPNAVLAIQRLRK